MKYRKSGWMLLGMMLTCSGAAQAELQRWTDEQGVIYYREVSKVDATATKQDISAKAAPKRITAIRTNAPHRSSREATRAEREQRRTEQRHERACARLQAKLDRIEQKLSAGYREPQGNALRRQRREVDAALYDQCR